ncbi:MAG: cbb3-type cytochrome c oxidase subunit I [Planctomycetes bacterium]|nr:cbb3-type cytochrome c oxidase subunit I [Planctomycetota bacterium]
MSETHAEHEAPRSFIRRYIFSMDHKVIGIQYLLAMLLLAVVGLALTVVMRWHLGIRTVLRPETYLSLMTMHASLMFVVVTVTPTSAFGNYFLPLQVGARDMAFPFLNMLSFWVALAAGLVLLSSLIVGAPISGWTAYPPLSAVGGVAGPGLGLGQTLWLVAVALLCVSSMMGALNFIATTLNLRTRGMSMMRLPVSVWGWLTAAVTGLLVFPVLSAGGIMLLLDRLGKTSFFVPSGLYLGGEVLPHQGGSPLLWQHLFWFFGHPEVYIVIVPSMCMVTHIMANFARRPIFGYRYLVLSLFGFVTLGGVVWGHHMFVSGMSPYSGLAFSILTLFVSIPAAIFAISWLMTLWGARIQFRPPMLYCLGFVSLFISGGVGGLFNAQSSLDIYLHDTYWVVGHLHLLFAMAAIFSVFAAIHFWFPKMFGRMMNDTLGTIHFWFTLVGAYIIFLTMHYMGFLGHPRRYAEISQFDFLKPAASAHTLISVVALITAGAQILFLFNFFWSLFAGRKAATNPWNSTSLEWTLPNPVPFSNFERDIPVVHRWAYDFELPGGAQDYEMQTAPGPSMDGQTGKGVPTEKST